MSVDAWLETKEQVRQAVDIVDLVGGYLQLRRQGRGYVALCPWHEDSRPSLQVNPERQSFKCWVCDIGGDVFSFVMQKEGVDFREALEMLAERAGIDLAPPGTPQRPKAQPGSPDDKPTLYRAMAWAEQQYHEFLLNSPQSEAARRYLADRGVSDECVGKFQIGFAPNQWDWLLKRAINTSFTPPILEKIGLLVRRDQGDGYYDRFRGRVLFSIRDVQDRPIATGGRILPEFSEKEPAKYINSPETPLFSKSDQVYALQLAREAIAQQRNVVVVEGYTDCIAAHQAGIANVVAVLGTALGQRHIHLLRRFADTITLVLDGDEAGQRRTNQILELFVAEQVDLRILTLPQNLDPCDFISTQGSEAFSRMLTEADDALKHKIQTVTQGLDIAADTHRANDALEDILGTIARAPRLGSGTSSAARLREHQVLSRLAREFRVAEEELRVRVSQLRSRAQRPTSTNLEARPTPTFSIRDLDSWDRELFELILCHPETLTEVIENISLADIQSAPCRAIYGKCLELGTELSFDRIMLESEDPSMKNLLVNLESQGREKSGSSPQQRLSELLNSYRRRKQDTQHDHSIAALDEGRSAESDEQALERLFAELRPRHRESKPTDG